MQTKPPIASTTGKADFMGQISFVVGFLDHWMLEVEIGDQVVRSGSFQRLCNINMSIEMI